MLLRNFLIELNFRIIIIIITWAAIVSYSMYFDLVSEFFIFLNLDFEMTLFSKEFPLLQQAQIKFIVEDDIIYYTQTYNNIALPTELKIITSFTYLYLMPYIIQTQLLLFYKNISYGNQYKNIKIQMQLLLLLYYVTILNITEMLYFDFIEENILEINAINPQLEYLNFELFQNNLVETLKSCQIFFIIQIITLFFIKNELFIEISNICNNIVFYLAIIEHLITDDTKSIFISTIYYIINYIFFFFTVLGNNITKQIIMVRKEGFEPSVVKHK